VAGSSPVRELAGAYVEGMLAFRPTTATRLGDQRYDHELGDPTAEAVDDYTRLLRTLRGGLDTVATATSGPDDEVDLELLRSVLDTEILDLDEIRIWERHPSSFIDPPLDGCFALVIADHLPADVRAESLVARLEQVPSYMAAGRAAVEAAPDVYVDTALEMARSAESFFAETLVGWVERRAPDHLDVIRAVIGRAVDAYEETAEWLEDMPRLGDFAIGEEHFAERLRVAHLLEDTPTEVADRGETILRATLEELREVAGRRDPERSWREQIAELKDDHPDGDGLLRSYEDAMAWTREVIEETGLVPLPPDDPELIVEATPAPWRSTIPYAAYLAPPPFAKGAPGRFWVTPPSSDLGREGGPEQLREHGSASITVAAVHEGYPGHHLQLSWANAHPSVLRRIADAPMFVEGWAFYCEELFHDHGLYDDAVRLWQLKDQIWRALRVVLDVDLHCGDETVDGAARALVEIADLEEASALTEVRRYTETPTYPLSYALGKMEFLAMRDRVRRAEGSDFDERRLHERLLRNATLPLRLAERALTAHDA
jgi:hypothetical protein